MRDIVIKFLQNNHFNQLDTELDFYTNPQNSEYFILSRYSDEELHNFLFEKNIKNSAKNSSCAIL